MNIRYACSHPWQPWQRLKELGVKHGEVVPSDQIGEPECIYTVEYVERMEPHPWCVVMRVNTGRGYV